jgi:hypothetical protein
LGVTEDEYVGHYEKKTFYVEKIDIWKLMQSSRCVVINPFPEALEGDNSIGVLQSVVWI